MVISIQSTDLRRRVREVLEQVQTRREPVVVRTYDTPQAVLIPYEDLALYQTWLTRRRKRDAWLAELQAIAEEVSARAALPVDKAEALISEAIRETANRKQTDIP